MADHFQMLFDGQAADSAFNRLVGALEVEENADLPGAFLLTLPIATEGSSGSEDLTLVGDARWKPYAHVAVVVTPDGGAKSCIFDGYVLSHKVHVERGTTGSTLRVWGQDASCLMNLVEVVKAWNGTDAVIANKIFDSYSFEKATDNDDQDLPEHKDDEYALMQRATDAQFLRDRARRNGKLFRVCCGDTAGKNTGYFITPKLDGSADARLVLNPTGDANVAALDFEWDVARPSHALAQVLLAKKEPEKVDTKASGLDAIDSRSLAAFIDDDQRLMQARLTTTADSKEDLKQRSASLLREAGWFVRCEGETDLTRLKKVLRAARVVEVVGAEKIHSGKYFVWSVRHTITSESHRMKFVLVRNAVGSA